MGAVTYVGAGTASVVDSGSTTPGLPAGLVDGDVLLMIDHITDNLASGGDAPSPTTPTGWTQKAMEVHAGPQDDGVRTSFRQTLFWRRWTTGTTAPTVTMGAGSDVGHRTRIFAVRGAVAEGDPTDVLGAIFKGPSEETDVGPIPGVSGLTPGAMVFVIGFGNDNWTDSDGVVATLTGDGLTWAEAEDYIVSVSGMADQGGVVAYAQAPAGGSVTSKTFSVANLYVFTSMGRMWAIRPVPARPSDFMPFFGL
jgi:hypothetical protein